MAGSELQLLTEQDTPIAASENNSGGSGGGRCSSGLPLAGLGLITLLLFLKKR
ncbi:MAG: hypothetical protein IJS28_03690 [Synergistaceae bacterium]|nr:hypothetical protein [Synergistaceae bacterium]